MGAFGGQCGNLVQWKLLGIYEGDHSEDPLLMGDMGSEPAILCSQVRFPVAGLGFIRLGRWLRGSCGDHQMTQVDARTEGCSLQTDSRGPIAEDNMQTAH